MLTSIPSFIDTRGLVIQRTSSSHPEGHTRQLTAVDTEGDSVTLTKWTQDVGPACVMPDERLSVAYQEKDQAPAQEDEVTSEDAYPLYRALKYAHCADNLDDSIVGYLLADLRRLGGLGGA